MCRHASFDVPPEPRSAPSARDFCSQTLADWGLESMIVDARLIISELVTNAVIHAGPPLAVTISAATGYLEIAVSDASDRAPILRPQRSDLPGDLDTILADAPASGTLDDRDPRLDVGEAGSVVGGRGLRLVDELSTDWGVQQSRPGKSVWARLPGPPDWAPAATCPCATGNIRLASGRLAAIS